MDKLLEAIARIQKMRDEIEIERKRIILHVLWRREELPKATPKDDPHTWDVDAVNSWYSDDRAEQAMLVLSGDDYEALDVNEGEQATFDRVLDVLQAMAHGLEPAQGAS